MRRWLCLSLLTFACGAVEANYCRTLVEEECILPGFDLESCQDRLEANQAALGASFARQCSDAYESLAQEFECADIRTRVLDLEQTLPFCVF